MSKDKRRSVHPSGKELYIFSQWIEQVLTLFKDANVNFYRSFKCCTAEMKQNMNLSTQEQQSSQMSLTKLGSAKVYRHHVGLDNCEGFTAAAKFLLPWDIPLKNEPTDPNLPKPQNTITSPDITSTDKNDSIQPIDETNWPALGQAPKGKSNSCSMAGDTVILTYMTVSPTPAMMVPSYEMFPALGASRQSEASERADVKPKVDTSAVSAPAPETKRDGRRRRRGDKSSHSNKAIHCYLHLEYECPLGHRFMSCGDGKVCKHGHMKQESAKRFLNQDSPIYILCPCNYIGDQRNSKPSITAQLQRIWIVAPDAPGSLKLNIVCKVSKGSYPTTIYIPSPISFVSLVSRCANRWRAIVCGISRVSKYLDEWHVCFAIAIYIYRKLNE
jgi:hypothetical protein